MAIPKISGLTYISNFLNAAQREALLNLVDSKPWLTDLKRRTQHYGYKYDYTVKRINAQMKATALPELLLTPTLDPLLQQELLKEVPDQCIVNEYLPGQGISKHTDCIPCFKDTILTISLGAPIILEFYDRYYSNKPQELLLEEGSALILTKEARYKWLHAIAARKMDYGVARRRRVSLTYRNVII
jgi:alkylated DNA repair dioxygenase AlkB